jgi:hypothetical protein
VRLALQLIFLTVLLVGASSLVQRGSDAVDTNQAIPTRRAERPTAAAALIDVSHTQDASRYREVIEKPLFFPDRVVPKPLPPVSVPVPVPTLGAPLPSPPLPPGFQQPPVASGDPIAESFSPMTARGIALEGNARQVLLSTQDPAAAWYGIGATVDGWTIEAIETDHVTLRRKGITRELSLYKQVN